MKKIIKKSGNSLFIRIDLEDQEIYDLKEGDTVDIEIMKVQTKKEVKAK